MQPFFTAAANLDFVAKTGLDQLELGNARDAE
jgi:hypothetical protein